MRSEGKEYIAARKVIDIDNGSLTWTLGAVAPADDFLWVVERNRDLVWSSLVSVWRPACFWPCFWRGGSLISNTKRNQ